MRRKLPLLKTVPASRRAAAFVGGAVIALAACSRNKPAPDSSALASGATNAPAIPAPASAAATATPEISVPSPSAATSVAVAAPAVDSNTRSPRPTAPEWCEAPMATLGYEGHDNGEYVFACKMIEVREWVMIWCPESGQRSDGKHLGTYDRALPGGGSMANESEVAVGPRDEAKDAVVISLRPGTRAKPSFTYRPLQHPEWIKDESFSFELPEGATSLDERRFNGGAWPKFVARDKHLCEQMAAAAKAEAEEDTSAQIVEETKGLDDIAELAAAPADTAWEGQKEVLFTGSDALGCKTKVIEPWFWMRCEGKVKASALVVEKGKRKTQTTTSVEGGAATLLTPYVEGTDLRAKLTFEGGERFVNVRWLKGKRPNQVGRVTETR